MREVTRGRWAASRRVPLAACAALAVSLAFAAPAYAACGPVALDPGHGGTESGASGFGLREEVLNWKVANYCQERLTQLGIPSFLTKQNYETLSRMERNQRAEAKNARVLVSFHFNSGGGRGAEVLVTNTSTWNRFTNTESSAFGRDLLSKLSAAPFNLQNRLIKTNNWAGKTYPDGSVADSMGINYYPRLNGTTGLIIEHAFIDNLQDATKLKSEAFLKQLGYADAEAIARHWPNSYSKPVASRVPSTTKNGWHSEGGSWYYYRSGKKVTGWQQLGGRWYWFDGTGAMTTGWASVGGRWYLLGADGAMLTGWQQVKGTWYWMAPDGAMAANGATWVNGRFRLFASSGAWVTGSGWRNVGGVWYWLDNDVVRTGWVSSKGSWYLTAPNGRMVIGWASVGGGWYYLNSPNGDMAVGWKQVGGKWYWLESSGVMKTGWLSCGGRWYYLSGSGAMVEGWADINGKRYYLTPGSGAMVTGIQTIEGIRYEFDASGALKGQVKRTGWYDSSYKPSNNAVAGSKVHYYDANGTEVYTRTTNTPIMGSPQVVKDAFVANLAKLILPHYPSIYRSDAKYGAKTPEDFAIAVWDAAVKEGVRPEVLAAQVGNETGWLKFGGIVNADQCNFGGIGALDGNVNGNAATFPNVQTGLLAQAQHLKAYASEVPLSQSCVDPRFHLVTRGNCPYVEDLGAGNWASSQLYGKDLLSAMSAIQQG